MIAYGAPENKMIKGVKRMESKSYTMDFAGRPLTLEFGRYCEQANGSVWVHLGDTVVMVNATMAPAPATVWIFSRSQLMWKRNSILSVRSPVVSSSGKAVPRRRRPSPAA